MAEKSAPAPVATDEEVAKRAEAAETEYGTYVALQPIAFNGTPAYNAGDPVPVSNVQKYKYDEQGLVAKVSTAAAQKVVAAIHESGANSGPSEVPSPVSLNVPVK